MNTTSNKLIAIVSIVALGLSAATASAKDKGNGGNNGGGNSNRSLSLGGSNGNKGLSIAGVNSNKNINIGNLINKNSNSNSNNNNSNNNNNNNNNNDKKKGSIAIGIGIGLANNALNSNKNKPCNDGHCYDNHCYNTTYIHKIYVPVYTCFRPLHCFAWVLPGDTWTTISLREYNNPNFVPAIAAFNGLSLNLPLVVGQQIGLPEIHPNGLLKVSFAPAPAPLVLPAQAIAPLGGPVFPMGVSQNVINANAIGGTQAPIGLPNAGAIGLQSLQGAVPQSAGLQGPVGLPNSAAMGGAIGGASAAGLGNAANVKLPSFAVGSVIALDGQTLGNVAGSARLKFAGVALSANVVEWTTTSVKIQLPAVDLTAAMGVELEVVRADGSLAIKTSLELTPAVNKVALGN